MDKDRVKVPAELNQRLEEGQRLAESGELDEAIEVLKQAADAFPDEVMARYCLSVACLMKLKGDLERQELWENLADDEGLLEMVILECEAALELQSDFVPALNNLAMMYALRGWHAKACEQWERSLSIDPDQPGVREDMALARDKLA